MFPDSPDMREAAPARDLIGEELGEIEGHIEIAAGLPMTRDPAIVVEQDAPHLLAALRLTLSLYGKYVSRDDHAAILAALTGQEGNDAR